jgi:RNA polymerase sigma-70 factor (ECF subfamily)
MDVAAELAEHRRFLVGVAYRLLGSIHAAEDVVQEAYVRAERAERTGDEEVADPRAWLTRIVTRLALDELRSARHRREAYTGPWLPEPLVGTGVRAIGGPAVRPDLADPSDRVTLDERVTFALMTVMESLSPAERAVYVLHEAFGLPFDEVADMVGRTPAACRQLATRARRHLAERAPRFDPDPGDQARVVAAFRHAAETGDMDGLAHLLDGDVRLVADGGGLVNASRRPIVGGERVARLVVQTLTNQQVRLDPIEVDGQAGLLAEVDGQRAVLVFVVLGGRITHIDVVANPEKLTHLGADPGGTPEP